MKDLPKVKITGQYYNNFEIFVNDKRLEKVIGVDVKFGQPHEVTVRMYADVDIETKAVVKQEIFTFLDNKKYKLQEVD